ncbi:MAG: SAM-dependent methyltransferase [Phycisphaerales bacterium]|nr:SAM-dependent methyltransferase [Phycisphaerales bacterium]
MEEIAAVPPSAQSAASLKPLLEECGYTGARLQTKYRMGEVEIPLVGFATRERDMDSACIAVVDGGSDPIAAVRSCYELAAPVVWVRHNGTVDWWIQKQNTPVRFQSTPVGQFAALVRQYKDKLDPISIYQGRTLARINPAKQLDFVDAGLLPLRREEAGKKLHDTVESMIAATLKAMRRSNPGKDALRDVFTSVFRMLAGKILKDKRIGDFPTVDLSKPKAVLHAVAAHYDTTNKTPAAPTSGYDVLRDAAALLSQAGSFAVVSPESLAYVYEHTLVTKELRKKLGIHATPPWLVDYMVWQLYDWVREIPENDRHVFEPACGHAPFLLSMMRLLRMEMHGKTDEAVHAYLKNHIHGVEIDDFAREIARLSLTLADIPNPNGWDLQSGDMFASDVLMREAKQCGILLSNPPYEAFDKSKLDKYDAAHRPTREGKAIEVLHRAIPELEEAAVFAVIVPQGVLHSVEAEPIRQRLLEAFDIREIALFGDGVFAEAEHETVVLVGRRRKVSESPAETIKYHWTHKPGVKQFAENYAAESTRVFNASEFQSMPRGTLRKPQLPEVWSALHNNPTLASVANVGQGFSFAQKGLIEEARRLGNKRTSDAVRAFIDGHTDTNIWEVPKAIWLSPTRTPVAPWRSGNATGAEQVLVNYVRAMRGPWRIKAFLDRGGCAAINTYNTVRPKPGGLPAVFLWALLNSPVANAFAYCNTMQKHNYDSLIGEMPLPVRWQEHVNAVVNAANRYLEKVTPKDTFVLHADEDAEVPGLLLALDAAVLGAYGLPIRLERALLDLFNLPAIKKKERRRKGVGCTFGDYFPANYKSLVPLHKYISAGYRGSTVDQIAARMKPDGSSAVTAALRAAAEAFGGDD